MPHPAQKIPPAGPILDRTIAARATLDTALLRRWWALWPAAVAVDMALLGPALHLAWHVFRIPELVAWVACSVALAFAAASTLDRRAGWPRLVTGLGYATSIAWLMWVWLAGPSWAAMAVLGWTLVAAWPVWLWHRWWRDRQRYVQVADNRWERRAGAPDPGLDRIGRLVRRWRKGRQRAANRHQWHQEVVAKLDARADAQDRSGRDATLAALAEVAEPITAANLARWTGGNRETVRRHLVALADDGRAERSGTPARPLYAVASTATRARARASEPAGVASAAVGEG